MCRTSGKYDCEADFGAGGCIVKGMKQINNDNKRYYSALQMSIQTNKN